MKKTFRLILVLSAALILFTVATVLVVLSSSGLQTGLARLFLPEAMSVEKVHLGFRGLTVEGGGYKENQAEVYVDRLQGDFSLLPTFYRRHLQMSDLTVSGVQVDLSEWEPKEPEPPPEDESEVEDFEMPWEALAEFKGLFKEEVKWPPVSIDMLNLDSRIILPKQGRELTIQAKGEDIRAEVSPALSIMLDYSDSSENALISRGSLEQELKLALSPEGIIKGIQLDAVAEADIQIEAVRENRTLELLVDLRQDEDATGENYNLSAILAPNEDSGSGFSEPLELLSLTARYDYQENTYTGDWSAQADTRAAPTLAKPILNEARASLRANGSFDLNPIAEQASGRGETEVRAEDLDQLQPELEAVPTFLWTSNFDLTASGEKVEVKDLQMELSAPAEESLISLRTRQPFGFDLAAGQPFFADPEEPLASFLIAGIPVDLVNAFLPDTQIALSSFTGEMTLSGIDDQLRLDSVQPLTIENFYLEHQGKPMLENLTIALAPSLNYGDNAFSFDLDSLNLSRNERSLLRLSAQGAMKNLDTEAQFDIAAEWDANLADLMEQPVAAPYRNLDEGKFQGSLTLSGSIPETRADLDLNLTDLALTDDDRELKKVSLKSDTLIKDSAQIQARGPLALKMNSENTDFQFDLDLRQNREITHLDFTGRGDKVFVNHFQTLAAAFQNPDFITPEKETKTIPEIPPSREPDTQPVWSGIQGSADLQIDEMIIPGEYNFKELTALVQIEEHLARLKKLETVVGNSPANAQGELAFRPDHPAEPYLLQSDFSIADFDLDSYLREVNPDVDPVLSAIVSLKGNARSEAPNLQLLPEFLTGDFAMNASDGIFRGMRRGAVSGTIDIATRLGGLVGRLTGEQDVEAVSQLVSYFNAVEFNEFVLQGHRNPDLTIDLTRLFMWNQNLRIDGTGKVYHEENRKLYQQPVSVTLDMGARRPLSRLFDELDLLEEEPGKDGYYPLTRPVEIKGNVSEPDPRPMWQVILEAAARQLLDSRGRRDREEGEERRDPVDDIRGILGF